MIENHHNLMIWENDAKIIFTNPFDNFISNHIFIQRFYVFHLWFVLNIVKLSLVYYPMIKSSIIIKFLIPKFSLIGKLRAALMLLHIITNKTIISLLKVEDIVRCKGNKNKVILIFICSKYQFSTLNFWPISDSEIHRQTSISRHNETIGHPSWFHRFRMVNWSLE